MKTKEETEDYLKHYLVDQRSCVAWNRYCMISDLVVKTRQEDLYPLDVNEFLDKLVQDGVMAQVDYVTPLGPSCAYLVGGKFTHIKG